MAHHLAHHVQQGKSLFYYGTVAPSDRFATRVGPVPAALTVAVVSGAVLYLTYRILD